MFLDCVFVGNSTFGLDIVSSETKVRMQMLGLSYRLCGP